MRTYMTLRSPTGGATHVYDDGGMAPPRAVCGAVFDSATVFVGHAVADGAAPIMATTCAQCRAHVKRLDDAVKARRTRNARKRGL